MPDVRRPLTVLVTVAVLTACGPSGDTDESAENAIDWSSAHAVRGADEGLAWADSQTGEIHLPDGTTLEADRSISSFVVAGRGAYAVDDTSGALVEVTGDGARETGAHGSAKASPDGRYLAFLDTEAGPLVQEDPDGDIHLLTSVVVDLRTGQEIFRSTRGMGNPQQDDVVDLYEDASYGVLGITDETAWIEPAIGDTLAIDLASGDVTTVADNFSGERAPWETGTISPPTPGGDANPDRTWGIYHVSVEDPELTDVDGLQFSRDELESADGRRVVPQVDAPTWSFEQWVDVTTVVGFTNPGLDDRERVKKPMPRSLLTCTVPDGACTTIPGSENATLPTQNLS